MDDLERVTARGYMPTEGMCCQIDYASCSRQKFYHSSFWKYLITGVVTDDILRARIKTVGVQEHCVRFEHGPDRGLEWRICG